MADQDPRQVFARRLRALREAHWPGVRVRQPQLAAALGSSGRRSVSVALIASWESRTDPKVPPASRLEDIATFFATRRSLDGEACRLLSLEELTGQELAARQELLQELTDLRYTALDAPRASAAIPSFTEEIAQSLNAGPYRFQDGASITIVCAQLPTTVPAERSYPLAERSYIDPDPSDHDSVELYRYSDLDSVVELYGHLRAANPTSYVRFLPADHLRPDDYTGHLVLLGGVDLIPMAISLHVGRHLPVRQVSGGEGGTCFEVTEDHGRKVAHRPLLDARDGREILQEDVALFARAVSPFNRKRFVTICNGIYGRGTYGAVRALTDERFRDRNAMYIQKRFANSEEFCILTRVTVDGGITLTPDWTLRETVLFEWSGP